MTDATPKILPPPKSFWRRWGVKLLLRGATLLLVVAVLGYAFPEQILTVDSGPVKADVMVVLGGGPTERPQRAAGLFKSGEAPLIICSGSGDAQACKTILTQHGVPAQAVLLETNSRTTRENAELSISRLRSLGAQRVIIVTSWFHSRRALACFEHYAPDITFYSRPSYFGYPRADANRKYINGYVKSEYWKLLGYWVCYGVGPF